ncbi:MAG: valine--tRNA ligase [Parcubacteria group bacterium]|nr:valine--tRNA ligase [Parcubacteria group bacterium]
MLMPIGVCDMRKNLSKTYEHQKTEKKIYHLWEKSGFFNPDKLQTKGPPFTIIMPPPNANDPLHIGHAVFVTLEDLLIRYHRMKGDKALWLPGTDHAGFETQVVFEKKLAQEGKSRFSFTRDEFYRLVWEYTQKNKKIVKEQLKKLGASCDWSREKFTLDKKIIKVVYETFASLWKDGLLYRGQRIVNYCPKHQTAFSELEVKYQEEKAKLYYVQYCFRNNPQKSITVATTRPETIPGDVAIAVNPQDERYKSLIGELVIEPITKREIPIIADPRVEIDFGTGALKITPAHDATDFEIGKDHNLEIRQTLNFDGRFNKLSGPLNGLKVNEARLQSIEILKNNKALIKEEDYTHEVGHCYKCGTIIEPMIMDQWFIDVNKKFGKRNKSLKELAIEAIKTKKIKIIPSNFEKVFYYWMENLKDWNISRQIYWGIRIPVWYCQEQKNEICKSKKGIIVATKRTPLKCPYCGSTKLMQDPDVLDTWFSSGQWPFATLMANKTTDLKNYYPTSVMETGWDILFFWVARMIMLGLYRLQQVPFKIVYLHGLVRDKDRQKMSKSKGNAIDPLAVTDLYGADALRMALVIGNSPGQDIIISEEKIRGYRNFSNKIWNASRFVLMSLEGFNGKKPKLTSSDKKLLDDFEKIKEKITRYLDNYRFSLAGETLYHYFWHTFADKIIEEMKIRIREKNNEKAAQYILLTILSDCLKMLHPFMPFITEAIWQQFNKYHSKKEKLLMISLWP